MATPRSNSACTALLHEVGKITFPSLSSCCADAPPTDVAVIRAAMRMRHVGFMVRSRMAERCQARMARGRAGRDRKREGQSGMPADGIGAARCDGGDFGMSHFMAARQPVEQTCRTAGKRIALRER